jgi:WD40-like Beta Propeller Repeat
MRRAPAIVVAAVMSASIFLPTVAVPASASPGGRATILISAKETGRPGGGDTQTPGAISADGRFVTFNSFYRLLPQDQNRFSDVYVKDTVTGRLELISVPDDGSSPRKASAGQGISASGRYVTFWSHDRHLVPNDTNGTGDAFVRDRRLGTTVLVSLRSDGVQADGDSFPRAISANGRFVLFSSYARNLLPPTITAEEPLYERDMLTGVTRLVSQTPDGTRAGNPQHASVSANGRFVVFAAYPEGIYLRDVWRGTTSLLTVGFDGSPANDYSDEPQISPDGRFVVFSSLASNLVPDDTNRFRDVFLLDRLDRTTELVSLSNKDLAVRGPSYFPSMSKDGRYIAFTSDGRNLVAAETGQDVYVRDTVAGTTRLVSKTVDNTPAGGSVDPTISADGRFIVFSSYASDVVAGDSDDVVDVFVRGPLKTTSG